jgi:hypothetical protein
MFPPLRCLDGSRSPSIRIKRPSYSPRNRCRSTTLALDADIELERPRRLRGLREGLAMVVITRR